MRPRRTLVSRLIRPSRFGAAPKHALAHPQSPLATGRFGWPRSAAPLLGKRVVLPPSLCIFFLRALPRRYRLRTAQRPTLRILWEVSRSIPADRGMRTIAREKGPTTGKQTDRERGRARQRASPVVLRRRGRGRVATGCRPKASAPKPPQACARHLRAMSRGVGRGRRAGTNKQENGENCSAIARTPRER